MGVLLSELWKACALPWKLVAIEARQVKIGGSLLDR